MSNSPRLGLGLALVAVVLATGCKNEPPPPEPPPDPPPYAIIIEGVTEGQVSREPVSPTWRLEGSGPVTEEATLDGAPFVSGTPVSAEGDHELVVVARDGAGRETRARVGFAIDTTAPRITVSGAGEGERRNTPVVLGYTVEEVHPGTVEATLDGAPFSSGGTVSAEGAHELVVVAMDAVGNRAEARRQFTLDTTPPVLQVLSPQSGGFTQASSVEVVVTAVDDGSVAGVWVDGAELSRDRDGKFRRTVQVEEGTTLLVLQARDEVGNSAQATVGVTRDSTPPRIIVTTPAEGAKVAGDSVQMEGQVEDATPLTVSVAGQAAAVGADGRFQLSLAVAQGPVSLEVVATDAAGNTARRVRTFRANTTLPRLDLSAPASGTVTEEPFIEVSGFARAADRTDIVKLEVAGGEHPVGPDGRFAVQVPLAPGMNTVSVTAVDGYGLRTTRTVRVERQGSQEPEPPRDGGSGGGPADGGGGVPDAGPEEPLPDGGVADEPPVLVLASPEDGSMWGMERVAVLGRVQGGTPPLEVTVEGVSAPLTGRQFSAFLALPEGSTLVRVRVVDARRRVSEVRRQVRVDQTPPFLEVTQPEEPVMTVTESPYHVQGLAGDAYLAGVTVNGEPALVLAGSFSAWVPLVAGENPVLVQAVDLAGNRSRVTRTLRVDGLPPQLRVLEPAQGSEARTPVVRVTMQVEASAPLAEVRIGTGLATEAGAGQYTAQVPLALGENVIPLMARDTLGLTGTASVRVRYRDTRTEPLVVTGVDPANLAEGMEPDVLVNVAFNKPVRPDSVRNRFTVSAGGQPLPGGWSVAPGGQTVSFIARDALPESATLQVRVAGVEPIEGPGMEGEFRSAFTVRRPLTRLRGYVVDEQREPLPGVRVEVEGQGLSTITGADGTWALFGAAPGPTVLRYEGGASSTGKVYPTVRRSFAVEAERDNVDTPLVLVPVDAESAEPVDTTGPVQLTFGGRHGALAVGIPASGLSFADGTTRGLVTATELPAMDRPVPTEVPVGPAWLWQLQPAGTRLMAPVELRFPNRGQAPPGHRAVIFTYDPDAHLLRATGLATVSADGTQLVSDAPVEARSLEFFGYLPLPEEAAAALASSLSGPLPRPPSDGLTPSLTSGGCCLWGHPLLPFLVIIPSRVVMWGEVRGPREQAVSITLNQPVLGQFQPVTLDSSWRYRLALSFQGRAAVQLSQDQQQPVTATVSAVGPDGVVLGPPSGSSWRQESPGGGQVELSTQVELKPGITQITLTASTQRGRDVVRLGAELTPDPEDPPDGGSRWRLRVVRTSAPSPEELEGQGVVRFSGMPITVESTWGTGASMSGQGGRYTVVFPHMQSYFLPPTLVRACVNLPPWSRVSAWTDAQGRVQTRIFRNDQLQECSATHEVWFTQETLGPVGIHIDARYLSGSLTFVNRQGQPLPAACESERDPETGEVVSLSPEEVRTTEVHFFLEHDPSQPIATYTVAHPNACEDTPPGGAHARYMRLRMGPSALRWLGSSVPASLRRNRQRLVPGDRLVVFALNHATGYAGMTTVVVPPISRSARNEDGSCPADEAAGGPIIVIEGGQRVPYSRCTLEDLGIWANLQLYPPELDVRVDRRAKAEGIAEDMQPSLVRHGGAATTRDDFVRVATHWRVRLQPAPQLPPPGELPPVDPSCDGGVQPDGGSCRPQPLYDEGRKGWMLERYCSEFTPPLTPEQQQVCLQDDRTLANVPPGVPPLAGRVVRITGSAVEEPAVASFRIPPGRSTATVQTSMRIRGQNGEAVVLNNLPRANHYVQVVGHSVFPRDRNQDGVIQPEEENAPPPDFTDGEGAPGLPRSAVELKNVYRSLEADGGYKVERFDRAREHEFRVLEVGSAQVTAKTHKDDRPVSGGGAADGPPAASPVDLSYEFLLSLLEPADPGRAGTLSGEYALRLGNDNFGLDCPVELDITTNTLRGTCEGEYLPDVLSASDIVYLEVFLRGNAENVLYRFNFEGLALREDYAGAASAFTADRAVEEQSDGRPVLDRPISRPSEAHFYISPHQLSQGRIRLCTDSECAGEESLIKEARLELRGSGSYVVTEIEGGKATAQLVQEDEPGAGGARHFRLALPASLAQMPGIDEPSPQVFLVLDPERPYAERSNRALGRPKGLFQGLHARAPGQEQVAGINLASLHLSFTHTDFSVPQFAETVSFSRTYDNQNDLPSPLGVGWGHGYDGFVVEEELGRYVVGLAGQAWGFPRCEVVDREERTARQCSTDKTHGMELEVDEEGVELTTEYGSVYRFDRPAVKRDREGRRKWLLTKFHDGHGRDGDQGWTRLTYAEESNRLLEVERTPGMLKLEFEYCEDFSQDNCEGVPADAAGVLKVLARTEDFKLLKAVVLKAGEDQLHVVRFRHDRWGNLMEAERTTDPPAQRWTYRYNEPPSGLTGHKAWRAINELSEARFYIAGQIQWQASYERGGAEGYKHLEPFECVSTVRQTGFMGNPLKVEGEPGSRTVTFPEGALARMGLNEYGNTTSSSMGRQPARQLSWPSSERRGEVRLASSTSPGGRTFSYGADGRMRPSEVKAENASDVAGIGSGTLASVTTRDDKGRPTAGRMATASGPASWSTPRSPSGDVQGLSVGSTTIFSRTTDDEGRVTSETDALGNTTTYSFGTLGLPTSAEVQAPAFEGGLSTYSLTLEYDAFGRLARRLNGTTGAEETWDYDGQGNLLRHTRSGVPSEDWTYEFTYGEFQLTVVERLQGISYTRTAVFREGLLQSETLNYGLGTATRTYEYQGRRLKKKTDERNVVWEYTYDDAGRLEKISANGHTSEQYGLDADGHVTSLTDRDGKVIRIVNDSLGRPVSWTYEDGHVEQVRRDAQGAIVWQKSASPNAADHIFDQQVDSLGRVLSTRSGTGSAGGVNISATYDAAGRVLTREDRSMELSESFQYGDALGRLTRHERTVRSKNGSLTWTETRTYLDQNGRTTVQIRRVIDTGFGDREENQTLVLDTLGRLLSDTRPGAGTFEYTYDARGNVRERRHARLGTSTYAYDGLGRLLSATEPGGVITTYTVDAGGLVTRQEGPHEDEVWTFSHDHFGRPLTRVLAEAGSTPEASWRFEYPGDGSVIETDPIGVRTTRRFNSRRLVLSEERGNRTTTYAYDGTWPRLHRITEQGSELELLEQTRSFDDLGRPLQEVERWRQDGLEYTYSTSTPWNGWRVTRQERWQASGVEPQVRTAAIEVDGLGNLMEVRQGGLTDAWTYDAAGVLSREALAGRPEKRFFYEQDRLARVVYGSETTLYTYDAAGRLETETDPSGRVRRRAYNAQGLVQSERFGTPDFLESSYTYDRGGFLRTMTRGGATWTFTHGPRGELQDVRLPGTMGTFVYEYDALLRLTGITPPEGGGTAAQTFTYDEFDRQSHRTRGASIWTTVWEGWVGTTSDPNGDIVERLYDGRGRIAKESYRPGNRSSPHTDLTEVTYAYDGLDQLLSARERRNSGDVPNLYEYDARNRLTKIQRGTEEVTYAYTPSGQKQQVTSPSGTVTYEYDDQDRVQSIMSSQGSSVTVSWEPGGLLSEVSGNGVVERYAYWGHGLIRSIQATWQGASPGSLRYEYDYDARGNRLVERYTGPGVTTPEVTQYGYDDADRLTGVRYPSGESELYALGPDGSRMQEKLVEGYLASLGPDGFANATNPLRHWRYSYDTSGGLEAIDDELSDRVEAQVTTDPGGRVVTEVRGGTTRQYGWDAAGRLASATVTSNGGTVTAAYKYGFDGLRRHALTTGGAGTYFVWGANDELLGESSAAGADQLYAHAGRSVVAVGSKRLLHDALGSVVGRVDTSIQLSRYGAWGELRTESGPEPAESGPAYAGQYFDSSVGLSYAQQRWYDPEWGRFQSEDPVFGVLEDPGSLNVFAYAKANPLRYIDPNGLRSATPQEAATIDYYERLAAHHRQRLAAKNFVSKTWDYLVGGESAQIARIENFVTRYRQGIEQAADEEGIELFPDYNFPEGAWFTEVEGFQGEIIEIPSQAFFLPESDYKNKERGRKLLARLDGHISTPVGSMAALAVNAGGGDQETQDKVLQTSRVLGGILGPLAGARAGRAQPVTPPRAVGAYAAKEGVVQQRALLPTASFEGPIYRYEVPGRESTTWTVHKWNISANHRYSMPGRGAVYGSTSPQTAFAEISHYNAQEGRVLVRKDVKLDRVLDLTNPNVRKQLGVSLEEITADSYARTHSLAEWARTQGYRGILAPSARNAGGSNLVSFEDP
jgi:RHS repeat-associated protein